MPIPRKIKGFVIHPFRLQLIIVLIIIKIIFTKSRKSKCINSEALYTSIVSGKYNNKFVKVNKIYTISMQKSNSNI